MPDALYQAFATAFTGVTSYVICQVSNQPNSYEKALLATGIIGCQILAREAIKYQQNEPKLINLKTHVLCNSARLLAIPCALYAGRLFNFKAADYLQITGLAYIGHSISLMLIDVSKLLLGKKPI